MGAKMAEALGYDAFYMSGGNTSAHQLGWPDSGTSMFRRPWEWVKGPHSTSVKPNWSARP